MSYLPGRRSIAQILPLERRLLLAAVPPTDYEQYLVEIMNRARANPAAEAGRHGIDLNEGLATGTISTAAKQPLAINPYITDAARDHSEWMIDTDTFSHTGAGSSNPQGRMESAGYVFSGSSTWGENIAWNGTTGSINVTSRTAQAHRDLFVDDGYPGRGHRVIMMNNSFREVGAGVVSGAFTSGNTYNAVMVTEDFATSGSAVFLTGVAYTDAAVDDDFYTPGEGLGGVTVTATRASDNATFSTTTWASGGYSVALTAGTYNITANGGGISGGGYSNVVIDGENVKRDFMPGQATMPFTTVSGGTLTVAGTRDVEEISIEIFGDSYIVKRNQVVNTIPVAGVSNIEIYGEAGDDYIWIGPGVMGVYINAGEGADYLQGGDAPDTLTAGAGKDMVLGGLGDDRVAGNGGHDRVFGEPGKDRLYGGEGNDTLDGGSSTDRMWGEGGNNTYMGQGQDDRLFARNGLADVLYGGSGTDYAQIDEDLDVLSAIEQILA